MADNSTPGQPAEEESSSIRHREMSAGQIFSPSALASLMASMLSVAQDEKVKFLDAGAGHGALTEAFLDLYGTRMGHGSVVTLVEQDAILFAGLAPELHHFSTMGLASVHGAHADFVDFAALTEQAQQYSHVLLNPPYSRIPSQSATAVSLSGMGVEVSNLYAAFLWLAIDLLAPLGELVAIVPRSFCNGRQFASLRRHLFASSRLTGLTVFDSRNSVFRRDAVLQETIIVRFQKSLQAEAVEVEWRRGDTLAEIESASVPHGRLVLPKDQDFVLRVPRSSLSAAGAASPSAWEPLLDGVFKASTGSVVDFRMKDQIVTSPSDDTVPLIGSEAFSTVKPKRYLKINSATQGHIFPPGRYVVIKRVSPPEQAPRIRALEVAHEGKGIRGIAFENHVNVIHAGRMGLTVAAAKDMLAKLNDPRVQAQFEEISGSTQVNVSDLNLLKAERRYPDV